MLKIKDDVDLKKLEKFGFFDDYGNWHKICGNNYIEYWINTYRSIEIFVNDDNEVVLDTTIYDLITAGLVEKVEE
jgi:hypothetical protein